MRGGRFFLFVMFGMALMLGLEVGGLQYVLLKLAHDFGLTQAKMGSLVMLNFAAAAISPIVAGPLADHRGKKPVALIFAGIYVISAVGCLLATNIPVMAVGIVGFGIGYGGMETVCQAAMADRYPQTTAQKLMIFQGVLSGGCVLAPLLLLWLMAGTGSSWKIQFIIVASGFLTGLVLMIICRFEKQMPDGTLQKNARTALAWSAPNETGLHQKQGLSIFKPYSRALMVGVLIGTFIYMFEENAVSYFMDAFYTNVLLRPELTAFSLSVFWASMTVSRFMVSLLHRWRYEIVLCSFLVSGILAFFISGVQAPAAALLLFGLSGAFYGPIWPFLLSMATNRYPDSTGTVTSLVAVISSAGGAASPVLVGWISDTIGQRYAFLLIAIVFLAGLVVYMILIHIPHRKKI